MKNQKIIYKVTFIVNSKGYKSHVKPIQVIETNKQYSSDSFRIKKNEMNIVKTVFQVSHNFLNFFLFCEKEKIDDSIDILKAHCIEELNKMQESLNDLKFSLNDD